MDLAQRPTPLLDDNLDPLFIQDAYVDTVGLMDLVRVGEPLQPVPYENEIARPGSASVPAVEDDAKPSPQMFAPDEQIGEEAESPFVQMLKDIKADARAQIAAWDPVYRGQATEGAIASQAVGTKRKGMS